ncbi:ceramide kinase-like isoform X2 [Littorina saxatilis]|uniref:DAGKc domain-containing protein n=1 Tax=Littorina saxatilis TaxID=31220 RepID=A0AAN9GAG6_9CAEN
MAEARHSRTSGAGFGDAVDGTLLLTGEVNCKGKGHQLHLTHRGLRLVPSSDPTDRAGATAPSVAVVDVTWRDVVCACEAPVKKSKSLLRQSNAEVPDSSQSNVFVLHYIDRNQKTNKLRCRNVTLEAMQGHADRWITHIEEKRKEGKPERLLVVINPIGGKGTARQTFAKRVQPLFLLAGVEVIVKVTERAKHAVEIAKTFAVSSVDGVISMGGDGLYMEILHGLTLRKQEEEGVDYNDPDAKLIPPTVRVGIIPAGTGNGVSGWFNGVIDMDTATLNIIRGEIKRTNIFSIHEPEKLIHYAGLLFGNGFFSKLIKRTDELRWMKRARYPYAVLGSVVGKKKILQFNIDVLKKEGGPNTKEGEKPAAEASSTKWMSLGTKGMTAAMTFVAKIVEGEELLEMNPFYPGFDLILLNRASPVETLKFMYSFFSRKKDGLHQEFVEWIPDIVGMRFEVADQREEGVTARERTEVMDLCRLLDVDGELMAMSGSKCDIRLHPQFLQVFCVPSLYSHDEKAET